MLNPLIACIKFNFKKMLMLEMKIKEDKNNNFYNMFDGK